MVHPFIIHILRTKTLLAQTAQPPTQAAASPEARRQETLMPTARWWAPTSPSPRPDAACRELSAVLQTLCPHPHLVTAKARVRDAGKGLQESSFSSEQHQDALKVLGDPQEYSLQHR